MWLSVPHRVFARAGPDKPVYSVVPVDASKSPRNVQRTELRLCGPGVQQEWTEQTLDSGSEEEAPGGWMRVRPGSSHAGSPCPGQSLPVQAGQSEEGWPMTDEEGDELSASPEPRSLRRTIRSNAGQHPNPFNLPQSGGYLRTWLWSKVGRANQWDVKGETR